MSRKTSHPIDQKLKEIEQQLREVQRSLRSLSRSASGPAVFAPRSPPVARAPSIQAPASPSAGLASASPGTSPSRPKTPTVQGDPNRFHRYFASASFPSGLSAKEEARLRRNRLILLATVALLLAWLIYWFSTP